MSDLTKITYYDHAATTPVRPEVLTVMTEQLANNYGNASSIYSIGRQSKKSLDEAREVVASCIGALPAEVFFTSGGSEADNWALKGVAKAYVNKGKHIITTAIEHHAILHTCQSLAQEGYEITYLSVDETGLVRLDELEKAIRPDTILVSIMAANNEIGTIQPLAEIGALCRSKNVLFHTDAVQAAGAIPLNMKEMNIDLCSFSSHKMYGPKGVGALFIRRGLRLKNLIDGGGQERTKRAGTENIAGIVGFAKAFELATLEMAATTAKLDEIRNKIIHDVLAAIPYSRLNGHPTKRLPNNINFSFEFIEGESLLLLLDALGYCCSSGSACTSGSLDPSHVLLAIGLPHEIAHGSLRVTLGHDNNLEEVDTFVAALAKIVQRLRDMSPLYDDFLKNQKA